MKLINYRLSIIYNVWDLPGVIVGAWITTVVTQNFLSGICGVLIMVLSIILFRKNHKDNSEMINFQNSKNESNSDSNINLKHKKSHENHGSFL